MLSDVNIWDEFLGKMGYIKVGGMENVSPMVPIDAAEEKKLKNLMGDLEPVLKESKAIIAGGAITSLFTQNEINDFDVYFRDEKSLTLFLASVLSGEAGYYTFVHHTDRSILITDHRKQKIQLVVYKFFPTVGDIFDEFDFTVNMGAYDFGEDRFIFHHNFFKHNSQRYIEINVNTAYPLISMLRVDKYRQKGYTVSKPQLLRLMFRINQLNLNSWDEVLDHVGGMYGVDPEKIFDKTKEFSIDEVINQLGCLETIDNTWNLGNMDFQKLAESLEGKINPKLKEILKSHVRGWSQKREIEKFLGENFK